MKTILFLSLFFLIPVAHAEGTFVCVHNETGKAADFSLEAHENVTDFTVLSNEEYCHPVNQTESPLKLSLRSNTEASCESVNLLPREWLTLSEEHGNLHCSVEGHDRTNKLASATGKYDGTYSIRVFATAARRKTVIAQDGNASYCADAPPYRWENPGSVEITMRLNASGDCFFERSYMYLNFFADGKKTAALLCDQFLPGYMPDCHFNGDHQDYTWVSVSTHSSQYSPITQVFYNDRFP